MRVATTLVSYNVLGRWDWTKQAVTSFRLQLGDATLVVIDHNHILAEREFLNHAGAIVLEEFGYQNHGDGIDLAVSWCQENAYDVLVHIEPDCLITGRDWYDGIVEAVENGAWMAGVFRLRYGPIHPYGSAWLVSAVKHSFNGNRIPLVDSSSADFERLIDCKAFTEFNTGDHWDTGLKNWFECARVGKDLLMPDIGIKHFWLGSFDTPGMREGIESPVDHSRRLLCL